MFHKRNIALILSDFYLDVFDFYNHFYIRMHVQKPTRAQTLNKITEELGELSSTISKNWEITEQEKEFGDLIVTVFMHGINSEYNIENVQKYINKKLEDRKRCCTVINGIIVKQSDIKENT